MAKILEMPKLSPTMEEGVLATWHKKEGDEVNVDDLLAEVETDKATMEFRAFDKGTILKLLVAAGANVKLGQPVAIIGEKGEDVSALVPKAGGASAPANKSAKEATEEPRDEEPVKEKKAFAPAAAQEPRKEVAAASPRAPTRKSALDRTEHEAVGSARPEGERVLASPYVRKAAREMGVDLQGAQGSGPRGRIVAGDLESLKEEPGKKVLATATAPTPGTSRALVKTGLAEPDVRPLSPMRKTIARRLTESKQTVPHFYLTIDVDAGELVHLREQINQELALSAPPRKDANGEASPGPAKVSLNDLLIKACATALTRVPECNAEFTPEAILVHRRVDISVAVAIADGLVTPVVRNADQKSVVAIAREVRELAARARAKKLSMEEMTHGTFSISNLGMFGVDVFSAVINPPEGAILAIGQVRDEAIVRGETLAPGKRLALTLSCDHRVVDGAIGAAFLAELRALLEHPMRVLTG